MGELAGELFGYAGMDDMGDSHTKLHVSKCKGGSRCQ